MSNVNPTTTTTTREKAVTLESKGDTAYMIGDPRAEDFYSNAARLYRRSEGLLSEEETRCRAKAERARREVMRSAARSGMRV